MSRRSRYDGGEWARCDGESDFEKDEFGENSDRGQRRVAREGTVHHLEELERVC